MNVLYHYVHCPYCVRVRMASGFLKIPYQSQVVRYDDEELPVKLCGKKMLPIMQFADGVSTNESLDIIKKLDDSNKLGFSHLQSLGVEKVEELLNKIGSPVHNLCMPYWVWTSEFDAESRQYFEKKKSVKRGPFKALGQRRLQFEMELKMMLRDLETNFTPYYKSKGLTVVDIMLASHLWGLYILPEFRFTQKLHEYLQTIKDKCDFNYHKDFF